MVMMHDIFIIFNLSAAECEIHYLSPMAFRRQPKLQAHFYPRHDESKFSARKNRMKCPALGTCRKKNRT
jgi:hypothetical protein